MPKPKVIRFELPLPGFGFFQKDFNPAHITRAFSLVSAPEYAICEIAPPGEPLYDVYILQAEYLTLYPGVA